MKKKQFNEMVAAANKLKGKIAALTEAKRRSSLSYLIESELEKAEIVLATKAIVDKIGKMAEDMLSIEGDDIMPMMDSLKAAYGPQMADAFQKACTDRVRAAVESLTATKDALSSEVSKLEGVFNGDAPANDMSTFDMDADAGLDTVAPEPAMDPAAEPALDSADAAVDPMGAPDLGDMGGDLGDDDLGGDPAGRARKESVQRKGKSLTEGLLSSIKEVLTAHFDDVTADRSPREQLEALKPFVNAADYEIASQFPDQLLKMIFDRDDVVVGDKLAADKPVIPMVPQPTPAEELGAPELPVPGDDMAVAPLDIVPSIGDDLGLDDDLAGDESFDEPMDMPFESAPARRLRESKNPDAMILGVYNKVVKEGIDSTKAIKKIAETFSIEESDVAAIVKEACDEECKKAKEADEDAKPGKDWNKLYKDCKDDGMTVAAQVAFIADNSKHKTDKAAIKAWIAEKKKSVKVAEAEGDVGFKDVPKATYPKATSTAIATKAPKTDPAGTSLIAPKAAAKAPVKKK